MDSVVDMALLTPRGLSSLPAAPRTRDQNLPTLLVSWWCTLFAIVIIFTRVVGRYIRLERLFQEDKVMALSVIPLLVRMGLVHVILLYGTNNVQSAGLNPIEIHNRSIGSRLVLASRIFYAMFIWINKLTVSEYLKRITIATWNPRHEFILRGIRLFLLVTFIGVVIGTLAECQPFDHYWQVVPDPGPRCRNGYAQLLTMGVADSITDIILIVFPLSIFLKSHMPITRKLNLSALFSLGGFLIVIAVYRMVAIIAQEGAQQRRSLWASIEILASASISNALVVGSFVRDRGMKKGKYKVDPDRVDPGHKQSSINRTMTQQHWGNDSDEDLFRSLGGRLNSTSEGAGPTGRQVDIEQLEGGAVITNHPNGYALHHDKPSHFGASGGDDLSLRDAGGILGESTSSDEPHSLRHSDQSGQATSEAELIRRPQGGYDARRRPQEMRELDIADAGGLLMSAPPAPSPSPQRIQTPTSHPHTRNFSRPGASWNDDSNDIPDVGGVLK